MGYSLDMASVRADRWARFSDERLLDTRLCDLKLTFDGSQLEPMREQLYDELKSRGIKHRPTSPMR